MRSTGTSDSQASTTTSGSSLDLVAIVAQAAALAVAGEESTDDEEDTWLNVEGRPVTLADVVEMLPGRLFFHETRFSVDQFKYLCNKLVVPDTFPTPEQRLASST